MLTVPSVINFVPTLHHNSYALIDPLKADLSGKHVLITGASKGIGRYIALSYARAGASGIAILARSDLSTLEHELLEAAKGAGRPAPNVLQITADTSNRIAMEQAARRFASTFDSLDILVNNAGYLEDFTPIADSNPDEWWRTWEVNIKGVYLTARSFLPLLMKSQEKTIIGISSISAHMTSPGGSAYQTSKSAVLRLNDFLMQENGHQGLIAYGVHPGSVMTELSSQLPEYMHKVFIDTPDLAGDALVFLTKERREW